MLFTLFGRYLKVELLGHRVKVCLSSLEGTSLPVQWLGLRASTAGGAGSIPGRGTRMPHAVQHGQRKKVH